MIEAVREQVILAIIGAIGETTVSTHAPLWQLRLPDMEHLADAIIARGLVKKQPKETQDGSR